MMKSFAAGHLEKEKVDLNKLSFFFIPPTMHGAGITDPLS